MLDFIEVVVVRVMFVLVAFSIAGLPMAAYIDRSRRWWVALMIAAITCVMPFWLLVLYTSDGDFTTESLVIQMCVLGLLAYGLAWLGLVSGRFVWRP